MSEPNRLASWVTVSLCLLLLTAVVMTGEATVTAAPDETVKPGETGKPGETEAHGHFMARFDLVAQPEVARLDARA